MCGFCAYITDKQWEDSLIENMTGTMGHRGPDAQKTDSFAMGSFHAATGHRRLSVIDTSENAGQPMWSEDGQHCIIYNGEVYNFQEIRKELMRVGYSFRSQSDTETILYGYIEWGEGILDKINGMFAFAIFSVASKEIFIARDRVGKKPLYYFCQPECFVMASELKPIFLYPETNIEVNSSHLGFFFRLGFFPAPYTALKDVYKLCPGSYMVVKCDEGRISYNTYCYWRPSEACRDVLGEQLNDFPDVKKHLEIGILEAVKRRLVSDVPVGIYLSSGIDSSIVAYYAQKACDKQINTYTIGFSDSQYDEAKPASQIAKYLGTNHHEYYFGDNDLNRIIDDIPFFFDEPFGDTSMLPSMVLADFAHQEITVALSGDGGDEIFGGYSHYVKVNQAQRFDGIGQTLFNTLPEMLVDKLPSAARRVIRNRDSEKKSQIVLEEDIAWLDKFLVRAYRPPYYEQECSMQLDDWQLRRMVLDMETTLSDDMLHKVDRASMASSVEVRSPLLDHELIELSFRIPMRYKVHGKTGKFILRQLAYDCMPKSILDQPKKGFMVPYERWLRRAQYKQLTDYSDRGYLIAQGLFHPEECQRVIGRFIDGDNKLASICWNFLMYQMWYDRYVCGTVNGK